MIIFIPLFLSKFFLVSTSSSFILIKVFNQHKRCSSTKLPVSSVNWSVSIWEHLVSFFHKRQRKRDGMTAMRRRKLPFDWWLVRLFFLFSGLHYQNVVGWGDTKHLPSSLNLKYKYFLHKEKKYEYGCFLTIFMISLRLQTLDATSKIK